MPPSTLIAHRRLHAFIRALTVHVLSPAVFAEFAGDVAVEVGWKRDIQTAVLWRFERAD